ncbi:MAG: Ppx/GppA phosphatase family protein [Xanthomonadales bacterium]|nr:Ppx/GppA phosphatase family protein [Xanthomonadales bacterium]
MRYDHGTLHVIDRLKEMVRLAEGVKRNGALTDAVETRALDCLERFGERLARIPTSNVRAVGTNALRRMKDGWRFLSAAEERLGHAIEIVSGQEEARLVYLGVAHGISERGNQRLVIDIGGGSTEFIIGRDFSPILLSSLYFGCVGIAQRHFADGKITRKRWKKARTAIELELQRIADDFKACGWQEALGSSGTMKAVRSVAVNQGWSERGITPDAAAEIRAALLSAGKVDKINLSGLSERRRPVFASGAVIVETCLDTLGLDRIIVADYALREGLLYDMLGRILHADPRNAAVEAMLERYRVDRGQAEQVRELALDLIDQVRHHWGLSNNAQALLAWGALLHEIGLNISHHGYHRHGAYLIENSDLPGFSKQEQLILAVLIRNHRRKPNPDLFLKLASRFQDDAIRITVLLRLAVLFNRARALGESIPVRVEAKERKLRLFLPESWLNAHPLTLADLREEASKLKKLDFRLDLVRD